MPDRQVYMIFQSAKKPGGRLDENLRQTLVDIASSGVAKDYIRSLPSWKIFEMYQQLEADIPASSDLPPMSSYHQVNFDDILKGEQHG
ncbi:MAG: hypothetical protein J6U54_13305 [Clostridiales bacterium]|nr:hypothetical protein [Clostridiales bacterium]